MSLSGVFSTTVSTKDPTSGHLGDAASTTTASDFITIQSFASFVVMMGAITTKLERRGPTAGQRANFVDVVRGQPQDLDGVCHTPINGQIRRLP